MLLFMVICTVPKTIFLTQKLKVTLNPKILLQFIKQIMFVLLFDIKFL